jgi:ABC-2 type transport system permease protein
MNKTFLVFKNELLTTIKRRSFILTLILIPLGGFILTWVIGGFGQNTQSQQISELLVPSTPPEQEVYGLVDKNNLIDSIPQDYEDVVLPYDNEAEALSALDEGKITAFYIIEDNYVKDGKITLVRPDFNPLGGNNASYMIEDILTGALLSDNPDLANRIQFPMDLEYNILAPETSRDPNSSLTFFLPYVVTMLFYMVILGSSSLMLNSITNEKSNRIIEILMTSIQPRQMLMGKIIALGLVGLLQTIVWTSSGYFLLILSGRSINLGEGFMLPPSILIWGILFFLAGYALYGSLMAGLGALVPNLREASQATIFVVIPMVIPLVLLSPIIENPNGALAITFSLIPFTAPITMMTRLSAGSVPIWQSLLSLVLIFTTTYFVIRSVAGFFKATNLLSGSAFNFKRFVRAFISKN